jgi:hypothetical protein
MSLNDRPWVRAEAARGDNLAHGWHAGTPVAPQRTEGRTPAMPTAPASRPGFRTPPPSWHPAQTYGNAGSYGHPYAGSWTAPQARPTFGTPGGGYSAPTYHAPAPSYHPAPSYGAAPRAFAPSYSPPSGAGHFGGSSSFGGGSHFGGGSSFGGGSHFGGGSSGGGSHFGGSGGGHSGGFGGGHHR